MRSPEIGRGEGWPTDAALDAQISPARGPYPRLYHTVFLHKQAGGLYQEQWRIYQVTRRRTADEELSAVVPYLFEVRVGRTYREATLGEVAEYSAFSPSEVNLVGLVQVRGEA